MIVLILCVTTALADSRKASFTLCQLFRENAVLQRDVPIPIWGTAQADSEVSVTFRGKIVSAKTGRDGKWRMELPAQQPGGPFDLSVRSAGQEIHAGNILIGDVWLVSGQSNAEFPVKSFKPCQEWKKDADYPQIRFLRQTWAPPHMRKDDEWKICSPETVGEFSATGFFFAKALQRDLKIPIGILVAAADGTVISRWLSEEALESIPDARKRLLDPYRKAMAEYPAKKKEHDAELQRRKALPPEENAKLPKMPYCSYPVKLFSTCFEEKIAPLIPFPIRGIVWYQGESNAMFSQGYLYRFYLKKMIADWRKRWNRPQMPFLIVEIPRYTQTYVWADLRDSQKTVADLDPFSHLVTILELGELKEIHPPKKKELADRLLLAAKKHVYGEKDLVASGPVYQSMKIEGNKIILHFDSIGKGLVSMDGQPLREFTIAGEDKRFYPAVAEISGDTVVVTSAKVRNPKAVRYAWRDSVDPNFANADGLSSGQFRTDDWKIPTQRD